MIRALIHFVSSFFSSEKNPERVLEDINKYIGSRYGQRRHRGNSGKRQIMLP